MRFTWMSCVLVSLNELDIFAFWKEDILDGPRHLGDGYSSMLNTYKQILATDVKPNSDQYFHLELNRQVFQFAEWIASSCSEPVTSPIGILSSTWCEQVIAGQLGSELATTFRIMLQALSLSYDNKSHVGYTYPELYLIAAFGGSLIIRELEKLLQVRSLATLSKSRLEALFIVLFGILILVGHIRPSCTQIDQNPHGGLINRLVHHLIYIAEALSLPLSGHTRTQVIEKAKLQWKNPRTGVWMLEPGSSYRPATSKSKTLHNDSSEHTDGQLPQRLGEHISWASSNVVKEDSNEKIDVTCSSCGQTVRGLTNRFDIIDLRPYKQYYNYLAEDTAHDSFVHTIPFRTSIKWRSSNVDSAASPTASLQSDPINWDEWIWEDQYEDW